MPLNTESQYLSEDEDDEKRSPLFESPESVSLTDNEYKPVSGYDSEAN